MLDEETPLLKSTEKSYYVKKSISSLSSESSGEQKKQESAAIFSKKTDFSESIDDSSIDFKDGNNGSYSASRPSKKIRLKRIRTICLVIALMIHSLFEGLTVGLQQNTIGVIILVALLSFHKCIVGFSLGIALVNDKSDLKSYMKKAVSIYINLYQGNSPKNRFFLCILNSVKNLL